MAEFRFGVTGKERKNFVAAVSEILNQPKKYLGTPSYAFSVDDYIIDREGTLIGEYNMELLLPSKICTKFMKRWIIPVMTKMPMAVKMCIKLQWIKPRHVRYYSVAMGSKPCKYKHKGRMIMKNEKALGEFMTKIAEAQDRLAELTAYLDDHMETTPENITWGDVGNAGYVVERLTELTDWAFKRGEYAE